MLATLPFGHLLASSRCVWSILTIALGFLSPQESYCASPAQYTKPCLARFTSLEHHVSAFHLRLSMTASGPKWYWAVWVDQWLSLFCSDVGLFILAGESIKVHICQKKGLSPLALDIKNPGSDTLVLPRHMFVAACLLHVCFAQYSWKYCC